MYENQKCQYCGEEFCKNDDIVVCPQCGAPYHRKCWEEHGECAFESKHKEGFVYAEDKDGNPEAAVQAETVDFIGQIQTQINQGKSSAESQQSGAYSAKSDSSGTHCCEQCGAQMIDGSEYCVYCGHKAGEPVYNSNPRRNYSGKDPLGGVSPDEIIMGEKAADIALTVRGGSGKFIPRFIKVQSRKTKISWSWPAFFFGYLYLFFRKLYKYGVIFILAQVLIFNIADVALGSPIEEVENTMNSVISSYSSSSSQSTASLSQSEYNKMILEIRDKLAKKNSLVRSYICIGLSLILTNLFCAMFFNYFYLRKCTDTIKKMKKSSEMLGGMTRQEYRFNLMARGGISFFGLFLGYFVKMLTEYLISYLMSLFI